MMFAKGTILADLQLIGPLPKNKEVDELVLQVRLCKMLGLSFTLSVVGALVGLRFGPVASAAANLGGLGPLVAVVLALRVMIAIQHYRGRLSGALLAWLCIIVGGLGMLSAPLTIGRVVWRALK